MIAGTSAHIVRDGATLTLKSGCDLVLKASTGADEPQTADKALGRWHL
jgi:hypothetical protein